ncbi:divergent PAP2 family protein [bacterium]|nr:divergent PAP2 family protein [bacterium]
MYLIIVLPLIAGLLAQIIKLFIKSNGKKFSLENLVAYSGMPSGHSAMIISLVTIIGLEESVNSPLFAISFILAVIVIRDALGFRRYLGQHGKTLNILVKDLEDDKVLDQNYPRLLEKIGHTPIQVLAGALIGFLVSFLGFFLL